MIVKLGTEFMYWNIKISRYRFPIIPALSTVSALILFYKTLHFIYIAKTTKNLFKQATYSTKTIESLTLLTGRHRSAVDGLLTTVQKAVDIFEISCRFETYSLAFYETIDRSLLYL